MPLSMGLVSATDAHAELSSAHIMPSTIGHTILSMASMPSSVLGSTSKPLPPLVVSMNVLTKCFMPPIISGHSSHRHPKAPPMLRGFIVLSPWSPPPHTSGFSAMHVKPSLLSHIRSNILPIRSPTMLIISSEALSACSATFCISFAMLSATCFALGHFSRHAAGTVTPGIPSSWRRRMCAWTGAGSNARVALKWPCAPACTSACRRRSCACRAAGSASRAPLAGPPRAATRKRAATRFASRAMVRCPPMPN
mmetsp:Transcript_16796/g.46254  ORF Transcript_16796/g.46254 Transcript_16796/m.46254 type:complete len:252 (+) Transcript_16796:237-992(+)